MGTPAAISFYYPKTYFFIILRYRRICKQGKKIIIIVIQMGVTYNTLPTYYPYILFFFL